MHSLAVAHLDIKPSNLLLAVNTSPKSPNPFVLRIADFACAQRFAGRSDAITATSPGTIAFWPPECFAAHNNDNEDPPAVRYCAFAADCFAVGLAIHCFLFRHLPYTCTNRNDVIEMMDRILTFDVSACDELLKILADREGDYTAVAAVERMLLQKDVALRYDIYSAAADIDTDLPPY